MGYVRQREGPCLDRAAVRRAIRFAWSASLLALVACHTPPSRVTAPERTPPAPAAQVTTDASYDWHGLLIAPFGSVLKDIPVTLHEVLLFRDQVPGAAAADNASSADAECYATDAPAPRFVGRIPDEYVLCFRQDRLSRIQASVRLTAAEAPGVFAAACADWSKAAAPKDGAPNDGAPKDGAPKDAVPKDAVPKDGAPKTAAPKDAVPKDGAPRDAVPRNGTTRDAVPSASGGEAAAGEVRSDKAPLGAACGGHDGAIRFRGRLEEEPGQADMPHAEAVLSVTLDGAPNP